MLPRTLVGNDEYEIVSDLLAISTYPAVGRIKEDE